jgi:hypothetical protein
MNQKKAPGSFDAGAFSEFCLDLLLADSFPAQLSDDNHY